MLPHTECETTLAHVKFLRMRKFFMSFVQILHIHNVKNFFIFTKLIELTHSGEDILFGDK